jgi:dTDP-4-amino-4,6-dideoxygalactose transaminase
LATQIISLPMFPHLTADQQSRVVEEISAFTSNSVGEQVEVK